MQESFDVLPIFMLNFVSRRELTRLSFENNEQLRNEWEKYMKSRRFVQHGPMLLPLCRDHHFYMANVRLKPEKNLQNREEYLKKLGSEPFWDEKGRIPLADEFYMKKTVMEECPKSRKDYKKKRLNN